MLRHIVLWNFQDQLDDESKQAHLARIRAAVESQVGSIPGLLSMTAALNVGPSEHCMDLVLESEFEDMAALAAYHENPAHHVVRDVVDPLVTDTRGVDYLV